MQKASVVITTYNRRKLFEECLNSILNQTYQNIEIVVVNDGEQKVSVPEGVKLIEQEHGGIAKAYNTGVKNATGDYIIFANDDDFAEPTLVEEYVNFIKKNPCQAVSSNYNLLENNGNFISVVKSHSLLKKDYQSLLDKRQIPFSFTIWDKKIFNKLKLDETLETAVDWEFKLEFIESGYKALYIDKTLFSVRQGLLGKKEHYKHRNRCLHLIKERRNPNNKLVSACLVTYNRIDDIKNVVAHLKRIPFIDDIVIWNNGDKIRINNVKIIQSDNSKMVYGRYLATEYARHDIIYTQDDDILIKNIPEIYKVFNGEQMAIGMKEGAIKRYGELKYGNGQVALVGHGAFYKKEWLKVLDKCEKDKAFYRDVDRMFTLLMNRPHNIIISETEDLPSWRTSGLEYQENHWELSLKAIGKASKLL